MKKIKVDDLEWFSFRQLLSLALFKNEPLEVNFSSFKQDCEALYSDLAKTISELDLGEITRKKGLIFYFPKKKEHYKISLDFDKFSSLIEVFLFLLPTLFKQKFRTILEFAGVTHSPLSYPTSFIKETFLSILERMGLYASLNLRRFGFYGSGGGQIEARVYPAELKKYSYSFKGEGKNILGAKIFISKIDSKLAKEAKEFLQDGLKLSEQKIGIIEILDSDGFGNSLQVFCEADGFNYLFFREIEIYNSAGNFIYDHEQSKNVWQDLVNECQRFQEKNIIPDYLMRELTFFLSIFS